MQQWIWSCACSIAVTSTTTQLPLHIITLFSRYKPRKNHGRRGHSIIIFNAATYANVLCVLYDVVYQMSYADDQTYILRGRCVASADGGCTEKDPPACPVRRLMFANKFTWNIRIDGWVFSLARPARPGHSFFEDWPYRTACNSTSQNGWSGPELAQPFSSAITPRPLPALFIFA